MWKTELRRSVLPALVGTLAGGLASLAVAAGQRGSQADSTPSLEPARAVASAPLLDERAIEAAERADFARKLARHAAEPPTQAAADAERTLTGEAQRALADAPSAALRGVECKAQSCLLSVDLGGDDAAVQRAVSALMGYQYSQNCTLSFAVSRPSGQAVSQGQMLLDCSTHG